MNVERFRLEHKGERYAFIGMARLLAYMNHHGMCSGTVTCEVIDDNGEKRPAGSFEIKFNPVPLDP